MDIFQNSTWYLSLFDSLATLSVSGIFQIAYSVHSPMLNYFCHISHIKLELSQSVKKTYGMELKQKDDLVGCRTRVTRLVVKMLNH